MADDADKLSLQGALDVHRVQAGPGASLRNTGQTLTKQRPGQSGGDTYALMGGEPGHMALIACRWATTLVPEPAAGRKQTCQEHQNPASGELTRGS